MSTTKKQLYGLYLTYFTDKLKSANIKDYSSMHKLPFINDKDSLIIKDDKNFNINSSIIEKLKSSYVEKLHSDNIRIREKISLLEIELLRYKIDKLDRDKIIDSIIKDLENINNVPVHDSSISNKKF